jgi:regulatory protein
MFNEHEHVEHKKKLTPAEALSKALKYCTYQERSHLEVKRKLYSYGLYSSDVEEILSKLITEGFLNEERFAKAFAGGKFRIKKWGKNKIRRELESQGLTKRCIETGLKELSTDAYAETLSQLILKKNSQSTEQNSFKKRDAIARYVIAKGYEPELVWQLIKIHIKE